MCERSSYLFHSHNPDVERSKRLLEIYEGYRRNPYPRPTNTKPHIHPPLDFDLDVIERVPTAEEFGDMMLMIKDGYAHPTAFLRVANNAANHPTNAKQLHNLVVQDPSLMIWPLAVIWDENYLALDKQTFSKLVRKIHEHRQGITEYPTPPPPPPPRRPTHRVDEWIDYD